MAVPATPPASSRANGLSSLDALRRKLEEDQARSRLARAASASKPASRVVHSSSEVPAATCTASRAQHRERTAVVTKLESTRGDLPEAAAPAVSLPVAAGGAARAASLLKTVEGGRTSAEEARRPPPVEVHLAAVESAVIHPTQADMPALNGWQVYPRQPTLDVVPRVPEGAPPARPVPHAIAGRRLQAGIGDQNGYGSPPEVCSAPPGSQTTSCSQPNLATDFRSNPDNFIHILRFLRDGKSWKAPEHAKEIENLREEAVYFGCMALVSHLDGGCTADDSSSAPVEISAMATDLADLDGRVV